MLMRTPFIIPLLSLMLTVSCTKEAHVSGKEIVFFAEDDVNTEFSTKATEVTSLSSFYVSAVTGSAGSESSEWGSTSFSGSGSYTGGKYWPSTNKSLKFYASNVTLSYAAAGTTVSASNDTDVIVAYKTDATYNTSNTLSFSHIFAEIGTVTLTTGSGHTLSSATLSITPVVSGTYNIRTGAWSGTSNGSAVNIVPTSEGSKNNSLMLVPGTYTLTASWTVSGGGASRSFSGFAETVTLYAGYKYAWTVNMDGTLTISATLENMIWD